MQIRRIEIRDFRKISHRLVDGIDDGLNVLVGDNEVGKSTLLAALRAAFFERHTLSGKPIEAMLPYGATVRPEIAVDFSIDGGLWRLRKAFNQRPEAELTGPGSIRLTGGAVEDKLAQLLGFTPPGRGSAKPEEHHGTHGLLWVEQGTRETLGVGAGRETLATALEREVGQVTGGDRGRALVAAASERRDQSWTKTDKPRGEWKNVREEVEQFEGERDALRARQQATEARVNRLADVAAILARHSRDDRLGRAVAAAQAARTTLATVTALDGAVQEATRRRTDAERDRVTATERRARRSALVAELAKAGAEVDAAAAIANEADTFARHRDAQARAADSALQSLRQKESEARTRARAIEDSLRRREALAALATRDEILQRVVAEDERRRAAIARAEAQPVDRDLVAALAKLEKAAEAIGAELRAAAVAITFEPEAGQVVAIDGIAHATGTPLTLARDAVLTLGGFGRLTIRPGGGTVELSRKADAAKAALRDGLAQAGFGSVAEARHALDARMEALGEAASLAKAIAALAPKGIDVLRQAVETERARWAQPASQSDVPADVAALDEARRAEVEARAAVAQAEKDAQAADKARQEALLDHTRLSERHSAAKSRHEALVAELRRARTDADDDLLTARLAAAEAAFAAASEAESTARAALDQSDPESTRLSLERAERAEREIRADIEALDLERRDIQAELRGGGQDGIGERIAELDGLIESKRKKLDSLAIEAEAAKLLHETLLDAQRDAKERWLTPVRTRVSPYLKLMAPGSEIDVDELTLELRGITRNGVAEPFSALSMGAREQVAVITRLALADVLRDAGHPAVVILDDALVNTDETRLDRMHNVLTRAAKGLQILILTCRERDFLGLGKVHRM